MEGYAKFLELNVWSATTIKKASWDDTRKAWTVEVNRDGKVRILTVKHLVFATGLDARPSVPDVPGKVCKSVMLDCLID